MGLNAIDRIGRRLFISESFTEGHQDKIGDASSGSILDPLLTDDPRARAAVETMATTGQVHVVGEVNVVQTSLTP